MRLTPHVSLISVQSQTFQPLYTTTNVYLIGGKNEVVMLDAGYAHEEAVGEVRKELEALGNPRVQDLIISHSHQDHFEGSEKIKKLTEARLLAHRLDIPEINEKLGTLQVEGTLEDGDIIQAEDVRLEVVHTPGHSPGHICLHLAEEKLLFTGDHIVGISTVTVGPPYGDMIDYLGSLQKLLRYPAQRLLPAHGPFMEDAAAKIQEYYDHRLEREAQIVQVLEGEGAITPKQLMMKIYAVELDERFYEVAERQISGHLGKLEKEGRILSHPGEGKEQTYTLKT